MISNPLYGICICLVQLTNASELTTNLLQFEMHITSKALNEKLYQ